MRPTFVRKDSVRNIKESKIRVTGKPCAFSFKRTLRPRTKTRRLFLPTKTFLATP